MSSYPTAIDSAATLYTPKDKTLAASLETALTANAGSADSTIQVADTSAPGFASANGVLTIDSEQILYTGKTATTFTGCVRGFNGSTAAAHTSGAPVRALFSSAYIKALQDALIAVETVIGLAAAYNFALASHQHAAGDIASGTMAVARLPVMGAASAGAAGAAGIVPQPAAGDQAKFLRADATWQAAAGGGGSAASITFTPFTGIEATNVQAAIEEVANERATLSHTHNANTIPYTPGGTISASNVQSALDELSDEKVPTTRTVTASGSGISGGGDLSTNISFQNTGVWSFKTRNGNVVAAAGDYTDTQIDCNPSGWPSWMNAASTVRQALNEIVNEIDTVKSDLASRYTNSQIDSGLAGKASNTHVHQEFDTGGTTGGPIG